MTSLSLSKPIPLTLNDPPHTGAVSGCQCITSCALHLHPTAPGAARNLVEILDCAVEPRDITHIREAIGLLLSDGYDVLRVLGDRALVLDARP